MSRRRDSYRKTTIMSRTMSRAPFCLRTLCRPHTASLWAPPWREDVLRGPVTGIPTCSPRSPSGVCSKISTTTGPPRDGGRTQGISPRPRPVVLVLPRSAVGGDEDDGTRTRGAVFLDPSRNFPPRLLRDGEAAAGLPLHKGTPGPPRPQPLRGAPALRQPPEAIVPLPGISPARGQAPG